MRSGDFQRLFPQNSKMESFFLFFDFWGFFLAKWSGLGSSVIQGFFFNDMTTIFIISFVDFVLLLTYLFLVIPTPG